MSPEELEQIRQETDKLKAKLPLPWILWQGKKDHTRKIPEIKQSLPDGSIRIVPARVIVNPPRYDIYAGPVINSETQMNKLKELGAKQVCHFHPESPTIYDQSDESDLSMPYLSKSLDRIDRLLLLIEEIKIKIGGNYG